MLGCCRVERPATPAIAAGNVASTQSKPRQILEEVVVVYDSDDDLDYMGIHTMWRNVW